MPAIPPGHSNLTWVIARTGDLQPYTSAVGIKNGAGGFSVADANALATAITTSTRANLSTGDQLVSIDYEYNDGDGRQAYSVPIGLAGTMTGPTNQMPQNCATLTQKRTSRAGKKGRGRMYWPTLFEAEVDNVGNLTAAPAARMTAMMGALLTEVLGPSGFVAPVLLHKLSSDPPDTITSFTTSPVMATQRRRLRK